MGIIVPIVVVAVVVGWLIMTHNKFVRKQLEVENGWSSIDIQLKRRRDLIPNLLETVKGYMTHESETLTKITELRASIMKAPAAAGVMGMENELTKAIGSLLVVAENYPALRANENFISLQEELASTENRIGYARQYYNEAVKQFNAAIRVIPASIVANMMRLEPRQMWNLDESTSEREAIAVKF